MDFSSLEKITHQIEEAAEKALENAGKRGVQLAQQTTLFKTSNSFKQAIQFHPISKYSGFVLADKPYAQYLEEGNPSQGFVIRPRNAKVLHFFINGKEIFTTKSTAHGPLPFMQQAATKLETELPDIFADAFNSIFG